MHIVIQDMTNDDLMRRACEVTMKGAKSRISRAKLIRCEHSPARLIQFWIEMRGIPSFVSTHLVRHKFGVEHFVESNRPDRGGEGDDVVNRNTPVNHGLFINAQALVSISRKRLCYKASGKTVQVWQAVRREMMKVCPEMAEAMVPDCVYRNGFCPELSECAAGAEKVVKLYRKETV